MRSTRIPRKTRKKRRKSNRKKMKRRRRRERNEHHFAPRFFDALYTISVKDGEKRKEEGN